MASVQQLADDLAGDGTVVDVDVAGGGHEITSRHGIPLRPPVRLVLSDAELGGHLARMGASASSIFPDVSPETAAYRLFLVHLDEVLATEAAPGAEIRLAGGELQVSPRKELSIEVVDGTVPDPHLRWDRHRGR